MKKIQFHCFRSVVFSGSSAGKHSSTIRTFLLLLAFLSLMSPLQAAQNFLQEARQILGIESGAAGHKCGFPLVLQANNPANAELHRLYKTYRAQQIEYQSIYISPSGHFAIHYDPQAIPQYDRNNDGFPDYLDFVAKSFDRAWRVEVDTLLFKAPPDSSGAPRSVYPVYCSGSVGGDYGYTDLIYGIAIPGLADSIYVTRIFVNTNFNFVQYPGVSDPIVRDSMAIAVTGAHEFNHALQMAYGLWPAPIDFWWIESSATYMEEVVAPAVNDYLNYVPYFYRSTDQPMDDYVNSLQNYGKVLLEIMLGKTYGRDITRRVWEKIHTERPKPALEDVLHQSGSDFASTLGNLSAWMFFAGSRQIPGQYFPDGAAYPDFDFVAGQPVKAEQSDLVLDSLPRLSFRWYESEPAAVNSLELLMLPDGSNLTGQLYTIYPDESNGEYSQVKIGNSFQYPYSINSTGLHYCTVNGQSSGSSDYGFRLASIVSLQNEIAVGPQPLRLSEHQPNLHFINVPEGAEIYIFTSNGKHLQTLRKNSPAALLDWDLTTKFGEKLGSGVYIYRLMGSNLAKSGKFVVIR